MNYQLRNDIFTVVTFLIAIVIQFASLFVGERSSILSYTGSDYIVYMGKMVPFVCFVLGLLLTCKICGGDFSDRTMNYEVLSGHTRWELYMGRIITSWMWCICGFLMICVLPIIFFSMINGWGYSVNFDWGLVRYGLLFVLLMRMITGFAVLTFFVKNSYIAMVLGYAWMGVSSIIYYILSEFMGEFVSVFFALMDMEKMCIFDNYKYRIIEGNNVMVFDGTIQSVVVVGTIVWSVIVILVLLGIGYRTIKKHDFK